MNSSTLNIALQNVALAMPAVVLLFAAFALDFVVFTKYRIEGSRLILRMNIYLGYEIVSLDKVNRLKN